MRKRLRKGTGGNPIRPYLVVLVLYCGFGLLLCLGVSLFIHSEYIKIINATKMMPVIQCLSALLAGILTNPHVDEEKIYQALGCVAAPLIANILISMLLFEFNAAALGWGSASVLLGGFAGFYIGGRTKNRKGKRNRRYAAR